MMHWTVTIIKKNFKTTVVAKTGESKGMFYIIDSNVDTSVEIQSILAGEHASFTIGIIALVGKGKKISIKTSQRHEYPSTKSSLYLKSIVFDKGVSYFKGSIRVEPNACASDAYQRSDTLLLGGNAEGINEPSLEILCDDVKCSHGATCGSIPSDAQWYGETRGIGGKKFDILYAKGFLRALGSLMGNDKHKKQVEKYIEDILQWRTL